MNAAEVISVIIGVCGFIVAFVTLWSASKKDTKEETKEDIEARFKLQSEINIINKTIETKLDTIDSGVRDLRADNRSMRNDLTKLRDDLRDEISGTHDEAMHATELAEAAHRRLDRMGAPTE